MSDIKTTGQLRKHLVSLIKDDTNIGDVATIAMQVNESISTEMRTAEIQKSLGQEASTLGELPIGKEED